MTSYRGKRGENPDSSETLSRIATLKNVLPSKTVALDKSKGDRAGFMLLSRYSKDENSAGPKVKEKTQKAANPDGEELEKGEQKTAEPAANTSSHNNEKKKRYALSLATLATKPTKRVTIVNEGAIGVLIELSSLYDKAIQVRCASAFASLSVEPSIRARMLDEGSLASIIALATNSNIREVKTDCARAICNLCCQKGYEFKMVKEGVPFVVTHVASTCPDAFEICLKILMNITCITDKFARIEDITEALMYFANANTTLTYDMELLMLTAFRNLAALRNNQLRLVEDGCLKIVDRFFQSSESKFRKIACEILKSLTMDWKTHTKLMEQNILSILLQMYHDKDEEIRMLCVKSFLYLAEDESFRRQIVDGVALSHLLNVSTQKVQNVEMCQVTAKTLRLLCADRNVAHKLVSNGVGHALITLLSCEDNLIQQFCAEALCGLFQTNDILELLVEQGAAQELVNLAHHTDNPHTCEWCSFALYQLAKGNNKADRSSQKMIPGGAVVSSIANTSWDSILPCIIYLCELENSTDITKRFCSAAFAHATLSKNIDCSGAIPLLVKMLRDERSPTIKKYCAQALFNLASSIDNCYRMLDAEALSPVVQLTQSEHEGDNDPKVICAGIISRLSLHKQYYDQFAKGNVLQVLLELSCVDHRLTQRRVVIALSNLSQNEDLKLKLLALNPIPYIISLASERDEYLRRGCISIVCNMSYEPGSEKAIVQAGIIPTLMITSMITSDQFASKIICVKALINLMADRSQIKSMVKDGIIWGLSKLAQLEHPEMLNLCADALCCLSIKHAREMLNSSVAVRTVLRLINNADLKLMQAGARILTNVLLKTNLNDEDFHRQVVDHMLPLARSTDKELNELCVICLCLASQSESCRTGIVSSGMLQMIDSSTIFSDRTVSYAYITMFGNIANNPTMRSRVLDDRLLARFERICESKNFNLHLAVAKALYCLSCSAENSPKLVEQRIIPMIRDMTETDYGEEQNTSELLSHLIATLYNLSTVIEIQHKLVSQGVVLVMQSVWERAKKDKDLCLLGYMTICHLACGRTNTTKMVEDGCTSIICFISEYRKNADYGNYNFTVDVHHRCSAALRNLLSVVSNQKAMVDQGCLVPIIDLANFASKDREKVYNPDDPSSGNFRGIWRNCAVALTSLTYNQEVRENLVQSEAINIILRNAEEDGGDINLGQGLMRELEAESWDNGARGRHKEGRSKIVKPATLYTELLRGGANVHLDVVVKDTQLAKFCVQVQLDEPVVSNVEGGANAISSGEDGTTSSSSSATGDPVADAAMAAVAAASPQRHSIHHHRVHHLGDPERPPRGHGSQMEEEDGGDGSGGTSGEVQDHELRIDVLQPHVDIDDGFAASTYTFEKQECALDPTEVIALFRSDDNVEEASVFSEEVNPEQSAQLPIPNSNVPENQQTPQSSFRIDMTGGDSSIDSYNGAAAADGNSPPTIMIPPPPIHGAAPPAAEKGGKALPNLGGNPLAKMFGAVSTSESLRNQVTSAAGEPKKMEPLPPLISPGTMRKRKEKFNASVQKHKSTNAKDVEFNNILDLIKDAKAGNKNASMEQVIDKWAKLSRY